MTRKLEAFTAWLATLWRGRPVRECLADASSAGRAAGRGRPGDGRGRGVRATLAAAAPALEIRDIAPPMDVFPWPWWVVALAALSLLLVVSVPAWLAVRAMRRRPATPPPTPRQVAFRELESLRPQTGKLPPYDFSVRVSDVLRTFVSGHFGLRATKQTSPEFLASISSATEFSQSDRDLLARFLERSDLIKFAHIDATETDSAELLTSATAFVQGSRA